MAAQMKGQKENYQKQLDKILSQIVEATASVGNCGGTENLVSKKPTLFLHACCAPCSSYVIEYLAKFFDITIYYYNPNIFPPEEYSRRLSELEKFLCEFKVSNPQIKLVKASYNPEEYYAATNVREEKELQTEHERGTRCFRCYELRMKKSYSYAAAHGYDWFATTLSISPHKDAEKINAIGKRLEAAAMVEASENIASEAVSANEKNSRIANDASASSMHITRWLPSDFKKRGGFKRSLELSTEYNLYRQDYCGCEFSARKEHL